MLTPLVFGAPIVMAPTIELHDQSVGTAIEVDDIRTDRVLTPKFHAVESPAAEHFPENSLGISRIEPQLPRPGSHRFGCALGMFGIAHLMQDPVWVGSVADFRTARSTMISRSGDRTLLGLSKPGVERRLTAPPSPALAGVLSPRGEAMREPGRSGFVRQWRSPPHRPLRASSPQGARPCESRGVVDTSGSGGSPLTRPCGRPLPRGEAI